MWFRVEPRVWKGFLETVYDRARCGHFLIDYIPTYFILIHREPTLPTWIQEKYYLYSVESRDSGFYIQMCMFVQVVRVTANILLDCKAPSKEFLIRFIEPSSNIFDRNQQLFFN